MADSNQGSSQPATSTIAAPLRMDASQLPLEIPRWRMYPHKGTSISMQPETSVCTSRLSAQIFLAIGFHESDPHKTRQHGERSSTARHGLVTTARHRGDQQAPSFKASHAAVQPKGDSCVVQRKADNPCDFKTLPTPSIASNAARKNQPLAPVFFMPAMSVATVHRS